MRVKSLLLVVDDGENMGELLRRIVDQYVPDLQVISACNGLEGVKKIRELNPDIILLDICLPDINGFEICRKLRADPETKNMGIILLSGVAKGAGDVALGKECGADDYVFKPFEVPDLVRRLVKILQDKNHGIMQAGARLKM